MGYQSKLSFRAKRHHVETAGRIAEKMLRLPEYELLHPTGRSVMRLALQKGAQVFADADKKYFTLEEALGLSRKLGEGAVVEAVDGTRIRVPYVNAQNVHLTPTPYADTLFAQGVVAILEGKAADEATDQLVHLPMPPKLYTEIKRGIACLPRAPRPFETDNAAIRLMLTLGLFYVEDQVFWRRTAIKDPDLDAEMRGHHKPKPSKVSRARVGEKNRPRTTGGR